MKGKDVIDPAALRVAADTLSFAMHDADNDPPDDCCVGEYLAVDRQYQDLTTLDGIEAAQLQHISAIVALSHMPIVDGGRGDGTGPEARSQISKARMELLCCIARTEPLN